MNRFVGSIFVVAICATTFFGQQAPGRAFGPISNPSMAPTPAQNPPAGLVKLFSNLGSKTDTFTSGGWFVSGPNNSGGQYFVAMPFSASSNSTATQVRVAVQYDDAGVNQVNLSIYTDKNGIPGTLIGGPITVKNLSQCCVCCTLTIGKFSPGVPIGANAKYWLVADTPTSGNGSNFLGVWNWVPPAKALVGSNHNGWVSFRADIQEPAGAVYGTVP